MESSFTTTHKQSGCGGRAEIHVLLLTWNSGKPYLATVAVKGPLANS